MKTNKITKTGKAKKVIAGSAFAVAALFATAVVSTTSSPAATNTSGVNVGYCESHVTAYECVHAPECSVKYIRVGNRYELRVIGCERDPWYDSDDPQDVCPGKFGVGAC